MELPLVSICCISYNHAPYIRRCLEGFLMQKTNFTIEVLIHDDASTDGTEETIREYAEKYPLIIKPIYQKENQYSKGKRVLDEFIYPQVKGKYIALCEGDDYWIDPLKLQKQIDILEREPKYSLCFHNAVVLNERGLRIPRISEFNKLKETQSISFDDLVDDWIIPTASLVFRTQDIKNRPDWHDAIYSGDFSLSLELFLKGEICYLNDFSSVYRLHNSGVSNQVSVAKWYEQMTLLLNRFDNDTSFRYHTSIVRKIKGMRAVKRYTRLKSVGLLLPVLLMPRFVWKTQLKKYRF